MSRAAALSLLIFFGALTTLYGENWPQWRGPRADGVSSEEELPLEWGAREHIHWRAPLAGLGTWAASRIVLRDRTQYTFLAVDFGVHLPLMDFGGNSYSLPHLLHYAETAESLGFEALSVNDHMVFSIPWLDGPTALAAVMSRTRRMRLATTVVLPIVRGPVQVAKTLAAIDLLSGGRLTVALGPGSSQKDYEAVGIVFEERWKRLDEAVLTLRALWDPAAEPFRGRFYSTEGIELAPPPAQRGGPPLWIGSWGSEVGLRRTARLGDGWLASAYNTTPETFGQGFARLQELLREAGREPSRFPNALATMWFHITEDRSEADRIFRERVVPAIRRPEADLRERLPIGSADSFAEKLDAFRAAGTKRVFLWPVVDEIRQIELFRERVVPQLAKS